MENAYKDSVVSRSYLTWPDLSIIIVSKKILLLFFFVLKIKACAKQNNPFYILTFLVSEFINKVFVYQRYFLNTYYSHKYMYKDSQYNVFARTILYTLALTFIIIPFVIWVTYCTIEFAFTFTWNIFFCLIYSSFHIKYFNICVFCFILNIKTFITFI